MADSKYQPVPRHDIDSLITSTEQSSLTTHHQSRHHLDPIDVSDTSSKGDTDTDNDIMSLDEEEGADETAMAPLNGQTGAGSKKNQQLLRRSSKDTKVHRWLSLLKNFIVRHRLALVAAAGLVFILLPLIAYQRNIRNFFWMDQVYVSYSHFLYFRYYCL